jgi:hypothetical protein
LSVASDASLKTDNRQLTTAPAFAFTPRVLSAQPSIPFTIRPISSNWPLPLIT